jgi:hypothetical protein
MGIVRLAKCLKFLNSLDEFKDRNSDVRNKIQGNRVYMDFVSIVYKTQLYVSDELNYLLFSFILINMEILNAEELTSEKLLLLIIKYSKIVPESIKLIKLLEVLDLKIKSSKNVDDDIKISQLQIREIVNNKFISTFMISLQNTNISSDYVYQSVIDFIVDMLTHKIINVEYILIAFDGIPSFGKIQEQRHRRYMHYAFSEFQKIIGTTSDGIDLNNVTNKNITSARKVFDKDRVHIDIRSAIDYVYNKYHSGDLQKDISDRISLFRQSDIGVPIKDKVIVDVIDRAYGEGEKILMDKLIKDYQIYKEDKSYVFYSPDGDSVLLCLHIYVKTKVNNLTVVKTYNINPSIRHNESSQYVNIFNLYNNIINLVEKFSHDKYENIRDMDTICGDFILMMNFYGNDFIHQIPTMDISTTFMDMMYIYSKFIKDNDYLTKYQNDRVHINFKSLIDFIKLLSDYENMMMLDTYMADIDEKQKVTRYFGDLFPCRYMIDYRNHVIIVKKDLLSKIKNGSSIDDITHFIVESIENMNMITTVSNKKYGDIWLKMEVKNANDYAVKIMTSPNILMSKYPKFLHHIRSKKKRTELEIRENVNTIEKNLIKNNKSIDVEVISNSNDKIIKEFTFDYTNIRSLIPHNQMPTTNQDIDIYMLEWKSGKWMHILNSYSFEIGYDWKKGSSKKKEAEMKRYQYDILGLNNTQMNRMIVEYMRTLSWMVDYYMNTDDESTSTEISTWSFNYDRVPFITHISNYLQTITDIELKNIMKGFYKKSLIPIDGYIKSDRHKIYIYPQNTQTIAKIPDSYKIYFPDMLKNIKATIDLFNINTNDNDNDNENNIKPQHVNREDRFFDCRMCPYFSKCLFRSKHITFKELMKLDINSLVQYTIIQKPKSDRHASTQKLIQTEQNSNISTIKSYKSSNTNSSQASSYTPTHTHINNNQYHNQYHKHNNNQYHKHNNNQYHNHNHNNQYNNHNHNHNNNQYDSHNYPHATYDTHDTYYKIPIAVRNMYMNRQIHSEGFNRNDNEIHPKINSYKS